MLTHCATRTDYVVPREVFGEDREEDDISLRISAKSHSNDAIANEKEKSLIHFSRSGI